MRQAICVVYGDDALELFDSALRRARKDRGGGGRTGYRLTNSPPVEPTRCVNDGFSLNAVNRLGSCFFKNSYVVKKVAASDVVDIKRKGIISDHSASVTTHIPEHFQLRPSLHLYRRP